MVTARYSNQQGSQSRQNPCLVQPTENIGNLSVSRRCVWVQTTVSTAVSGVLLVFQNLNYKLQRRVPAVLPIQQSHQKLSKRFSSLSEGYTKTSYATFYKPWHRPMSKRFIKHPYSISRATPIDSDCCRLPTAFDSRAQRFSTPLARRRLNCPPPSPNLVRTHPIERYRTLLDSAPCLSRAATSRRAPN